ncbi:hypothetical protein IW261DRAFT_905020 [Armillaria novae-zelandiae]|uniref:Uncharacterized protein n=1 Tax=Armillaria novae-zelandiae TaxID=153914 RepID=A0AA39NTB7_9AGAR|nr:hypothetical protein IW261DRAFT_905020 [Armillaria novae-zelandiae]
MRNVCQTAPNTPDRIPNVLAVLALVIVPSRPFSLRLASYTSGINVRPYFLAALSHSCRLGPLTDLICTVVLYVFLSLPRTHSGSILPGGKSALHGLPEGATSNGVKLNAYPKSDATISATVLLCLDDDGTLHEIRSIDTDLRPVNIIALSDHVDRRARLSL